MEVTAKELRSKPGQIIEQASRGTEVVITIHGKKLAKLIPYSKGTKQIDASMDQDLLFGMWKDRETTETVDNYVRRIRRRRIF